MNTYSDSHYRYPGTRSFEDSDIDRSLFFGRDKETQLLLHETLISNLVVMYGKSGLGKTSLINAGLNQALRDRGFIPFKIRFNTPGIDPLQAVFDGISHIAKKKHLDYEAGEENSLWQFFKTAAFWGPGNTLLKPVLILDQFEEFFTLHSPGNRKKFIWRLADLVNNTIPFELKASIAPGKPFPYSDKPPNVKIIISIREDFLGQLEEMSENIPAILHHRFRLMPLNCEQARQAIIGPSRVTNQVIGTFSFQYSQDAVDTMLTFLCKRKNRSGARMPDEVEPFQLQLLCRHIEENKVRGKPDKGETEVVVQKDDLGGEKGMQSVLQRFYDDQLDQLGSALKKNRVRKLCEKGLISVEDRRLSLEVMEIKRMYNVSEDLLAKLVDRRLLRSEPRVGSIYYELSHDTLVAPIRESQKKRNFKSLITKITIVGIIGVSILLVLGYFIAREDRIYQANLYNDAGKQKKLGNYKKAKEKYSAITKINKNNANAFFELGDTHQKLGEYDKAIEAYRNAIETDPGYILPKINLTAACLIEKRFKEADDLIKKVLNEKDISPQYYLAMRFLDISSQLIQKEHQELIIQIRGFMDYYRSLTRDYVRNWDYSLSRNLVEKFPLQGQQKSLLLKFYDILESSWEEGKRKLDESEASVYNIIGHASLALKKNNEAIKAFKKAVELDPQKTPFKTNLAAAYLITKHFKEADELAKEILKGKISIEYRLIMRGVSIASLMFQGRNQQAKDQLKEFIRYYKSIKEDYKPTWDYSSARELISSSTLKFDQKGMLLIFLNILESSLEEGRREIDKLNL